MTNTVGTDKNFKSEVIDYQGTVIVDFWASWCGPCLMLAPVLEEVIHESGETKLVKVDVDVEINLASQYNISSIPAVIIFKNGQPQPAIIGFHQKEDYLKALK